jgi:hypothetical protein
MGVRIALREAIMNRIFASVLQSFSARFFSLSWLSQLPAAEKKYLKPRPASRTGHALACLNKFARQMKAPAVLYQTTRGSEWDS